MFVMWFVTKTPKVLMLSLCYTIAIPLFAAFNLTKYLYGLVYLEFRQTLTKMAATYFSMQCSCAK